MPPTAPSPAAPMQADFYAALFGVLISRAGAAVLLGVSPDHVTRMCEDGTLAAYNVAASEQDRRAAVSDRSAERMLRVVRASVIAHTCPRLASVPASAFAPDSLLSSIHRRPTWFPREVATLLDCSEQHIFNLIARGLLKGPCLTNTGSGRGQFIFRESIASFLDARAL